LKPGHRQNILDDLLEKGMLWRYALEADRGRYGLDFTRRIRELDKDYEIERTKERLPDGTEYVKAWVFVCARINPQKTLPGLTNDAA